MDLSFDSSFKNSGVINFYPYIGDNYIKSNPKILILGESHYISNEKEPTKAEIDEWNKDINTTRGAVEEEYKPYKNTLSVLSNMAIDNNYLYNHLAFYNFFQKYVGIGSSDKSLIDDALIELSQKAYFAVFDIIKPNLVIAWGTGDLYNYWVPQVEYETCSENGMLYNYKKYPNIKIWHMRHPSARNFDLFNSSMEFSKICKYLGYSYPIKFDNNTKLW